MTKLADVFDVAADAYEEGRDTSEILGEFASWYDVIGPVRGRPRILYLRGFVPIRYRTARVLGTIFLESGFVYAPYVPLQITSIASSD